MEDSSGNDTTEEDGNCKLEERVISISHSTHNLSPSMFPSLPSDQVDSEGSLQEGDGAAQLMSATELVFFISDRADGILCGMYIKYYYTLVLPYFVKVRNELNAGGLGDSPL